MLLGTEGDQILRMLGAGNNSLGGEKAGAVEVPVTTNQAALSMAGATNASVAIWASEDPCVSGTKKS